MASAIDLMAEDSELEPDALISMMRRQIAHLERLADDLLDFGHLLGGVSKLAPQRFNLAELLRQVVEDFAFVETVTIDLEVEDEALHVFADAYAVRRILQNLIGNAVKFSTRDHVVTVRASGPESEGVRVRIEDEAGSLHSEELERLFKPFIRKNHETAGQGLGLFIVRSLAEASGAQVWLESRPGGSCFNLAFSADAAGQAPPGGPAGSPLPGPT
jgi:two-component system CheB/CheR fusion protein